MRSLSYFFFAAAVCAWEPVQELVQEKYLGHWFQVYSDGFVEATFENHSVCVTADYGVYPNSTISVLNRERVDSNMGPERRILGWAETPNPKEPGKLQVNLQTTHFPAPYWVFELGPPTFNGSLYEYSIVSDPFGLTLFVLARNLTEFAYTWADGVLKNLTAAGYTGLLNTPILTNQTGCW